LETLKVDAHDFEAPALRLSGRQLSALLLKLPRLRHLELVGLIASLRPALERAAAKFPQLQLDIVACSKWLA
jgi:hypothetical protein